VYRACVFIGSVSSLGCLAYTLCDIALTSPLIPRSGGKIPGSARQLRYGNKIVGSAVVQGTIYDNGASPERSPRRERIVVSDELTFAHFEQAVLPHLAAAYNLARWLTRNDHDAEDVVQEAYVCAFKFCGSFHGGDSRAWLLAIVRHTCYTWLQHNRGHELMTVFDEEIHSMAGETANPETLLLQRSDQQCLRQALEELPVEFREVIVLRELEGLSYKEIAHIAEPPPGNGHVAVGACPQAAAAKPEQADTHGGLR
jgi:RNA polymerase sigma-70 factor, ECF subfamily